MPYHVTFTDENYEFLLNFLTGRLRINTGMNASLTNAVKAMKNAKADNVQPIKKPEISPEEKLEIKLGFTPCKEHPLYGAKRSPRSNCKGCWAAYGQANPDRVAQARKA